MTCQRGLTPQPFPCPLLLLVLLLLLLSPQENEGSLILPRSGGLFPYEECKFPASGLANCIYSPPGKADPNYCNDRFNSSWSTAVGQYFGRLDEYPNAVCDDIMSFDTLANALPTLCVDVALSAEQCTTLVNHMVHMASPGPFCFNDTRPCQTNAIPPARRNPELMCQFDLCPSEYRFCPIETKTCFDGTVVNRDPTRAGCPFHPCPPSVCQTNASSLVTCMYDAAATALEAGTGGDNALAGEVKDDDACVSTFKTAWETIAPEADNSDCADDLQSTDITFLLDICQSIPLSAQSCQDLMALFQTQAAEKPVVCAQDVQICTNVDGSAQYAIGRDPKNDCQFLPCSDLKCCDPMEEYGKFDNAFCYRGSRCCPTTGEWTCSIGDGKTFICDGEETMGPFGQACDM